MGKIVCLMGKSGSGKDTLGKALLERERIPMKPIITYTTRPKRENETDGVEYHFIETERLEQYKEAGKVIECREYQTNAGVWRYCTIDDGSLDLADNNYLIITTLEGFSGVRNFFGNNSVVPLYVEVEDGERLERLLHRERMQSSPDYVELCRRFVADASDFAGEKLAALGIVHFFVNENVDLCVARIEAFLGECF